MAASLGENVALKRFIIFIGITLLCGTATSMTGPIAFLGLMAPHALRALVGPDYRLIIPLSAVFGAVLLMVADTVRVTTGDAVVFTKDAGLDADSTIFSFAESEDEKQRPKSKKESRPAAAATSRTRLRHERATNQNAEKEEARTQHQKEIHKKEQEEDLERFLQQDKVNLFTGPVASNVALAVAPLLAAAKVPYLTPNAGPSQLAGAQCSPYFFGVSYQNDAMHDENLFAPLLRHIRRSADIATGTRS